MHFPQYLFLFAFCLLACPAEAQVRTASPCTSQNVQQALDDAQDGDIVQIAAGLCTWTQQARLSTPKAITVQGAGIDSTIIVDNIPKAGGAPATVLFPIQVGLGKTFRLTGITFRGMAQDTEVYNKGTITLSGDSHDFRIDHIKFDKPGTSAIRYYGALWGLIDHCIFDLSNGQQGNIVQHESWNGKSYGDGSYADSLYLGTEKAIYIEDNTFIGSGVAGDGVVDGYAGGRVVFRYNSVTNDNFVVHGTESPGRFRSMRSYEVYGNTFTANTLMFAGIYLRGGTGVVWGNKFAGGGGQTGYQTAVKSANYRSDQNYPPFGFCNGSGVFDGNTQADGYPCIDQVGRGTSDLLSGNPPSPAAWPHQAVDPLYIWGNIWSPVPNNPGGLANSQSAVVQENRDYFVGLQRPGYSPYDYPHPLSLGVVTPPDTTPPTSPSGLTATAASPTRIDLAWSASTDNTGGSGMAGYRIERCQGASCSNYAPLASIPGTVYSDIGLSAGTAYRYRVSAYDVAQNVSQPSTTAGATTWTGAYPWSGILSDSRAIDWSQAGIPGGIPNRTTICANILTTDTNAQIQAKINSCPQDGVVKFPSGTWTLTSSLYSNKGVVLRGNGPTNTKIVLGPGTNIFLGISGTSGQGGYPPGPYAAVNWTGGLSKGDTILAVANTAGMAKGQTIILDQLNNPNLVFPAGSDGAQGAGRNDGAPLGFNNPQQTRLQFQMAEISTVIDGTHIEVNPPVDYTHDPALAPQVFFWNPNGSPYPGNMRYAGVEDLHVDANHRDRAIIFTFCSDCWVKNVQIDNIARGAVTTWFSFRNEIRDSYISAAGALAGPTQYGLEIIESPYTKLENNIMFNVTAPVMPMTDDALVVGYNYAQHIYGPDNQFAAFEPHQAHSNFHLYEGNVAYMINIDNVWGSASQMTLFRNQISGLAPNKYNFRIPLSIGAHQRYMNFVGNVLGTQGYHVRYQVDDVNGGGSDNFIYQIGFWNRWDFDQTPYDSVTKTSAMRWGNWDVVTYSANGNTNGVRWCTGAGAGNPACTASETANSEPLFPGLSNPSTTLPASFYLAGKPSWFGNVLWPVIGPDVNCASNCIANTANHAAKIPAQLCYENGTKDANGYLTAFDANVCYGSGVQPPAPICGDHACNNGETCSSCPGDCGVCVPNPPPPPGTGGAPQAPDVTGINNRTFTTRDDIVIPTVAGATGFNWDISAASGQQPATSGQQPVASSQLLVHSRRLATGGWQLATGSPVPTTAARLPLSSFALTPGAYVLQVQATNNAGASPWASAKISVVQADFSAVKVFPNPWKKDKHAGHDITFDNLTANSTVKIFTIAGHLVRELPAASGQQVWDLKNDKGDAVASGIYVYVVTDSSGNKKRGKVAVVR